MLRQCEVRPGEVRQARHVGARQGTARRGKVWQAWHGKARLGEVRQGMAGRSGQGTARRGKVRLGTAGVEVKEVKKWYISQNAIMNGAKDGALKWTPT